MITWRRSSYSRAMGNCVEVGWRRGPCASNECVEAGRGADGRVHVRDSKDPDGPVLTFPPGAWDTFLGGVRRGDFGLPLSLR